MIIYEVNLSIQKEIADSYKQWLKKHMSEMLKIEGFNKAQMFYRDPTDATPKDENVILLTIHYTINDRKNLERYFSHEAKKMRQEAMDLFGNKFSATRRVLELHEKKTL